MSRQQEERHQLLVPRQDYNHWSTTSGKYGKERMPALVTGREASRWETDVEKMKCHIEHSSLSKAMYPRDVQDGQHFKPLEVPILDILAMEANQKFGWQFRITGNTGTVPGLPGTLQPDG